MNVLAGKPEFIMIGQLSNFLDHLPDLVFGCCGSKTGCLNLKIAVFQYKLAVIKTRILLQEYLQIKIKRVLTNF